MENSAHPARFVKSEIIEALNRSVTDAAHVLDVTRPALSVLLNGQTHLAPEMVLGIEKAFSVSVETLMTMQNSFGSGSAKVSRKYQCLPV